MGTPTDPNAGQSGDGTTSTSTSDTADTAALQERIAELEAELAAKTSDSGGSPTTPVDSTTTGGQATASSPAPSSFAVGDFVTFSSEDPVTGFVVEGYAHVITEMVDDDGQSTGDYLVAPVQILGRAIPAEQLHHV